jgi:predicted dehydrogenase
MAFTKVPELEVVAVADADLAGREAARLRTQAAKSYADYREMLEHEQLDIVAICTRWLDQHAEMIVAAAKAGCHVYMEKPFCRTLAECDTAIEALETNGRQLAIAHISEYSPVLDTVRALIAGGEIGEVLELRARGKEDQRGGAEDLWVLGSHVFGMMRTLAGSDALNCSAVVTANGHPITRADVMDGAEGLGLLAGDHVQARYQFPGNVFGYFASRRNMAGRPSRFGIQVFGSKGVIQMESGYLVPAQLLRDSSWSPGRSGKSWEQVTSAGVGKPESRRDGNYEGGHVAAITDLLASIREDRPPRCSAHDGRAIVEMIAAVFESQRTSRPVQMPLATRENPLTLID